jgi:hypothetical protein
MDERLKQALDFSNYQQTVSIQIKQLKERFDAKLTLGYNGGLFKIDRSLISFVQMLIDQDRSENVPFLDLNQNPVLIENLNDFRDEILDRYFSGMLEYYSEYDRIKKSRSIKKLVEYE